jgi:16S rRNA (cytosine967-C5)-methyltransferase
MTRISPARAVALEVLREVGEGAFASDALRARSRLLDARDAGLASRIVFGCLRYQKQLDWLIFFYSGKTAGKLDAEIAIALRTAIFQMRYLDRVPAHAAVSETVEWVKAKKRAAAGLVNAVLRKVNRKAIEWPDEETELSCPEWLLARWRSHFGSGQARAIAQAALAEPPTYIRLRPGKLPPEGAAEPTDVEGCWRVLAPILGARHHDISSQAVLPLLEIEAGDTYLDLCAAPGNKTIQALETPLGLAVACDISERRLRDVAPVCARVVLDAARPLPFAQRFDRIFVDAPCTGTGTLARNPEIKWRVAPQDFGRASEKQRQILAQALKLLAPRGKLLYATCSLELEENEDVVRQTLASQRGLRLTREMWRLPGRDEGDGFYAAVLEYES